MILLTFRLLTDVIRLLPRRLWRVVLHTGRLFRYAGSARLYGLTLRPAGRIGLWLGELFLLLLDIVGFPEWFECINCWIKPGSRPLQEEERVIAGKLFGQTIPLDRIRLDERAYLGPRQYQFCYVSFCLINSWRSMPSAVLVHELVHVWQFCRAGSPYLLRALLAQRTRLGYDYGGLPALRAATASRTGLQYFSYEQQASIVEDYFRLQRGGYGRWLPDIYPPPLAAFAPFVEELSRESDRSL